MPIKYIAYNKWKIQVQFTVFVNKSHGAAVHQQKTYMTQHMTARTQGMWMFQYAGIIIDL